MKRATLGFIGAGLLAVGCFLPLVHIGFVGDLNYFSNGKGLGVIILVLAAISLLALLTNHRNVLWLTGAVATATIGYTFVQFVTFIDQMERELSSNPFGALANPQMSYGWIVLAAGCALLLVGATREKVTSPVAEGVA